MCLVASVVSDFLWPPWTVALQAPLSMGYCWQEYWSGLPFPPEHLHNPGIKPESLVSPALQAESLPLSLWGRPHGYMSLLPFSCPVMSDSLWPHDCSTPGFPVPHHLPEFAHVHVHWVGDAVQPSHSLTPSSPIWLYRNSLFISLELFLSWMFERS